MHWLQADDHKSEMDGQMDEINVENIERDSNEARTEVP